MNTGTRYHLGNDIVSVYSSCLEDFVEWRIQFVNQSHIRCVLLGVLLTTERRRTKGGENEAEQFYADCNCVVWFEKEGQDSNSSMNCKSRGDDVRDAKVWYSCAIDVNDH